MGRVAIDMKPILFTFGVSVAVIASAHSALLITDDFNDGSLGTGPLSWSAGSFSGGGNTNLTTATGSNPAISGDGRGQLLAVYPSTPNNGGYAGVQLAANTVSSTLFQGYQLSQITIQFDAGIVTDKSGSPLPVLFEIRQSGFANGNGGTHRFMFTPIDNLGTMQTYSFTLDTNLLGPNILTNFDTTSNKSFVFQLPSGNYATNGVQTTTTLQIDNFIITAVPEPGSLMLGAAALCLAATRRRR